MQLLPSESQAMVSEAARRLLATFPIEERRKQWHGEWLSEAYSKLSEAGMLELAAAADDDRESQAYLLAFGMELGRSAITVPFLTSALAAAQCLEAAGHQGLAATARGGSALEVMALAEAKGCLKGTFTPNTRLSNDRLTGVKCAVPFAGQASHLLVSAVDADGELQLIRVPSDAAGVQIDALDTVAGELLSEVSLDCPVENEWILLTGEAAIKTLQSVLTRVFMVQSAMLVGGAERALEIVSAHVIERHQFEQPLGAFQAVQHHVANSRIHLDAARLMTFELGWRLAEGNDEMLAWAAETKAWVSSKTAELLRRAHELQGGISVTDEHETMLLLRRNLAESVMWGSGSDLWALAYPLRQVPPTVQPLFAQLN